MKDFTFGSLFTGIGGIDLGLERAGWEVKFQVEIDEYCRRVLEKHWPGIPRFRDVRDITEGIERPDLICGGFPCQPVSVAGKRKGKDDERWLWPEFFRVICLLRPNWVLAENVPGLLSIDAGRIFGGILRDLASIGYDAQWDYIPACAFGAPHLRYRVFLVAYPNSRRYDEDRREGSSEQSSDKPENRVLGKDGSLADSQSSGRLSRPSPRIFGGCRKVSNNDNERQQIIQGCSSQTKLAGRREFSDDNWWSTEPDVGRVVHGVPFRVDRLKSLGNAVVPQVAEWIGRRIIEVDKDVNYEA